MEKVCLAAIVVAFMNFSVQAQWNASLSRIYGCTNYTLYKATHSSDWEQCKRLCLRIGSDLVSFEKCDVWSSVLKNIIQKVETREYFIGMKKDVNTGEWRWIANNSTVNTSLECFAWASGQPTNDNDSYCAKIYPKSKNSQEYVYDDLKCTLCLLNRGCICQKAAQCPGQTTERTPQTKTNKESKKRPTTTQTLSVTLPTNSALPAQTTATLTGKPVDKSSATEGDSQWIAIILALLAVVIMVILILIWVFYARQRWNHKKTGTTSKQQSATHDKNLKSFAELKERERRVSLSSPEDQGLDTYETVNEVKLETAHAVVDTNNRKPRSDQREPSAYQQRGDMPAQTPPDDGTFTPMEEDAKTVKDCEDKIKERKERKDCVYAIVHIRPGGSKDTVCKEPIVQGERLDATCPPQRSGGSVELANLSPFAPEKIISHMEEPMGQNPNSGDECKDYLYAVVDTANKKRKPPQMPSPYRGPMYAELRHSSDKNTSTINRASLPTVYAVVDHLKTVAGKPRLPEENVDGTMEFNNALQ